MSLRRRLAAAGAALLAAHLALPAGAAAFQATGATVASASGTAGGLAFSVEGSVGALAGKAYERVYDYSTGEKFKISQLDWEIKGVAALGLQGSVGFAERFSANVGIWTALNEGDQTMIDRDWLLLSADTDEEWTHESRHPDTALDEATMFDLNLSYRALSLGAANFSAILGYKADTFSWSARGGTYVYSDLANGGYRDQRGSFPNRTVIEYEQKYSAPYFGLGVDGAWGAFALEGHLLLSPWVSASDKDYHVLRDTLFEGDFSGGVYAELGLKATYFLTPRFFLTAALESQAFDEITGDVTITAPEGRGVSEDGGSVEIATTLLSLGGGLRF